MEKLESPLLNKVKKEFLKNILLEINGIASESSGKNESLRISELRILLQEQSLFMTDNAIYKEIKSNTEKLFLKCTILDNLEDLYHISIITNTEISLKINILKIDSENLSRVIEKLDSHNTDIFCRIFSLDSKKLIDIIKSKVFESKAIFKLIFRISESAVDFDDAVSSMRFTAAHFDILMEEIKRNPCRASFIEDKPFYNDFLKHLALSYSQTATFVLALLFFYTQNSHKYLKAYINEDFLSGLVNLSKRNAKNLFLMIRRLTSTAVDKAIVHDVKKALSNEKSYVKRLILYRLISEELDLNERLEMHRYEMTNSDRSKNSFGELSSVASVLNLPLVSLSLIKCTIDDEDVRNWIPTNDCNTLLDFFKAGNLYSSKIAGNDKKSTIPLVSVIITVFNPCLDLFQQSITSILLQKDVSLEVIVVDDASNKFISSKIQSLIDSLSLEYNINIIYIKLAKNEGQYFCRNEALKHATGEYICIQDDDDISHPLRLSKQVNALESKDGTLICYAKHIRINENLVPSIDDRASLSILGDGPATLLFKRKVIDDIGGFRVLRSRGDIEFRERAINYYGAESAIFLPYPLYLVRSSLTSISSIYEYLYNDKLSYYRDLIRDNMNYRCVNTEISFS